MNLHAYLCKHDLKPRSDGPELLRLAQAAGRSAYYLYLGALGHKRLSAELAVRLHEESIDNEITPPDVCATVSWHCSQEGYWLYRKHAA